MNAKDAFNNAAFKEQLDAAAAEMIGRTVASVEWEQTYGGYPSGVRLTFVDGTTAEFGAWADYADDMGMDVTVADKEVSYDTIPKFIGPPRPFVMPPPGTMERTLRDLYFPAITAQLNESTSSMKKLAWIEQEKLTGGENNELPESPES